jgi:hypothetical protein
MKAVSLNHQNNLKFPAAPLFLQQNLHKHLYVIEERNAARTLRSAKR